MTDGHFTPEFIELALGEASCTELITEVKRRSKIEFVGMARHVNEAAVRDRQAVMNNLMYMLSKQNTYMMYHIIDLNHWYELECNLILHSMEKE